MSSSELAEFVSSQRTITCATNGQDGWPHLMPLWYIYREPDIWAWTYAKSQKVRNLERDSRCTLQIETGATYNELRGVMFKAEAVIHRDLETAAAYGLELAQLYGAEGHMSDDIATAMRSHAAKRVALQFVIRKTVSWDHRKITGY